MKAKNQQKNLFELAFDQNPLAILVMSKDGLIINANQGVLELFGYSVKDLLGKEISFILGEKFKENRFWGLKKNGEKIPVEVNSSKKKFPQSEMEICSLVDLTFQLNKEKVFKDVIESAPNAMLLINEKGQITLVNQLCEVVFQYKREELLGQNIEILVPDNNKHIHPLYVRSYINNPTSRVMGEGRELFGRRKNGDLFPVEVGLRPIFTEAGISIISSVLDISERVRNKKLLLERNEELQHFAYRASHDLKSPLISIAGLSEIMGSLTNLDDIKNHAAKINALSKKLNSFVDDILDLTKLDHQENKFSAYNFKEKTEDIKLKIEGLINERSVDIQFVFQHQDDLITQVVRMNQIIENLVSNGVKYCDEKKEHRFVRVTTHNDEKYFTLTVEDNGLGIEKKYHSQVFEMFSRFHSVSIFGSGLGLYLVKKNVEKINGTITFESEFGQGTKFIIKILRS